ncbi:hypothetical protein NSU_3066 [Novosphingobium pentaromativorans US6-1]|uniref:Uncharacterized protein n=1 Tax=Novosphingobium pentaromativorans US6-1 TaxID=1088721 RepID=G6EFE5_9SPHN|nr:hypothetical protein NSU_3066 [Novosphingobium pentaromativorans US6-1]
MISFRAAHPGIVPCGAPTAFFFCSFDLFSSIEFSSLNKGSAPGRFTVNLFYIPLMS